MPTKEQAAKFRANGQCPDCGRKIETDSHHCRMCIEAKRKRSVEYRKKLKEQKRCSRCGYDVSDFDTSDCPACTLRFKFHKLFEEV